VITIKTAGDAALLFETGQLVHSGHQGGNEAAWIAAAIRAAEVPGVIGVVPGASTVLVTFRPSELHADRELQADDVLATGELIRRLLQRHSDARAIPPGLAEEPIVIDTVYGGPDLADVAARTGLTVPDVIALHEAGEYQVGWLGFSPGFGYLIGLDPRLELLAGRPYRAPRWQMGQLAAGNRAPCAPSRTSSPRSAHSSTAGTTGASPSSGPSPPTNY
jgi:allophanate hydrolase subunit 1